MYKRSRRHDGTPLWVLLLIASAMIGFLYFFATLSADPKTSFGNLHQKSILK